MHGSRAPLLTLASDEVADEPTPTWFEPTSGRGRNALDEPFVEHEGELDLRLRTENSEPNFRKGWKLGWPLTGEKLHRQNGNQAHECPISAVSSANLIIRDGRSAVGTPTS